MLVIHFTVNKLISYKVNNLIIKLFNNYKRMS